VALTVLPLVLAALACAAYGVAARRARVAIAPMTAFAGGALTAGGLVAWDPQSLAAHMVQHGLLTTVAAPLLVLGQPVVLALRVAPARARRRFYGATARLRLVLDPWAALIAFVAVQWFVHWPAVLDAGEAHPPLHAALHLLLLASAVALFLPVLGRQPVPRRLGSGRAGAHLAIASVLVDLISVPYVAGGHGDAAAAMLAAMAPLALLATAIAWRGVMREEREMRRREALT
jgi:cytochrome c oxidase assembly factor CtaG